ncbi:MAG: MetQ/NlpA family ABC transporter substrate-binding protein [Kyrpidia sp.]|nr:MetQ/NlpA family ABC transporter substrate-binding protein [Kyrpidia sp.]
MHRRTWGTTVVSLVFAAFLAACGNAGGQSAPSGAPVGEGGKKEIRVGFSPGPYADQFRKGIQPYLEKKGYTIRIMEFSDWIQPNFALANKSIDANVYQHTIYLQGFNQQHHLDLTGVVQVPTAPMGIYSKKHHSLDEVKPGSTVVIPNDPANQARALVLLQQAGWLELKKDADPIRVSEKDVVRNIKQVKLEALEAAQAPRALADADYSVITGNYAISAGIKLTEALLLEKPLDVHILVVAVRTEDKDKPFVKDIVEAYHSPEFKQFILTDPEFAGYALPAYMK